MRSVLRRFHYLINRRRFDEELANDLEFHREMSACKGGMALGNALRLREEAREAWGWMWIDRLGQDLRYAARVLWRSPAFALAAILMLALGIGVNVAVFAFFNLVVLRPINVREPASLFRFHRSGINEYAFAVPYPQAAFFAEHAQTLSAVIAVNRSSVVIEREEKLADACFVTSNFFTELGGVAALGRLLNPSRDEASQSDPVVVLSHGFWRRHFGADPSIVGQTMRINDTLATIIGVAASDFSGVGSGIREPALWAPITLHPYFINGSRLLTDTSVESPGVSLWARVRTGQPVKAAEEELASLTAELRRQHPADFWEGERLLSEPGAYMTSMITGNRRGTGTEEREPVYAVFALAGILSLMILAVACGNLGSLLLGRGVARQREIAIRVAIGAGSRRLIRQLFTESLLLALLSSILGLVLGTTVQRSLLAAAGAPVWITPIPDWRTVAFSLTIGFGAAILFGLTPALQIGRQHHRARAARHILISGQVAASCALLIVAWLLVRALHHATSNSPGFDYGRVILISPSLSSNGYTPARSRFYLETLAERLRGLAGVQSVSMALSPPLGRFTISVRTEISGRELEFQVNRVSAGFFETMSIPIVRGRSLRANDQHVAVVSESMARQAWSGEDALGKSVFLDGHFTVVGVSGNVRSVKFGESDKVHAYFPIDEGSWPLLAVLVRTVGPPQSLAKAVTNVAATLDSTIFPDVVLLSSEFRANLAGAQYVALAVGTLGLLAQILACFGIVGVVSYAVSQRMKEIAIRMALGAQRVRVLAVVLRHPSLPVAAGLIIGESAAAGVSQFLRGRLYGLSNLDPGAYAGAVAVFLVASATAALLPARKALRIDPWKALRHD